MGDIIVGLLDYSILGFFLLIIFFIFRFLLVNAWRIFKFVYYFSSSLKETIVNYKEDCKREKIEFLRSIEKPINEDFINIKNKEIKN